MHASKLHEICLSGNVLYQRLFFATTLTVSSLSCHCFRKMLSLLFAAPLVVATQRQVNDQNFVDQINAQPGILWTAGVFLLSPSPARARARAHTHTHTHTTQAPPQPPQHTIYQRTHSLAQTNDSPITLEIGTTNKTKQKNK